MLPPAAVHFRCEPDAPQAPVEPQDYYEVIAVVGRARIPIVRRHRRRLPLDQFIARALAARPPKRKRNP